MSTFKRTFAVLVTLVAVGMASVAQTVTLTEQTQFVIAKGSGSVNIRKAPNTKAAKAGQMYANQTLPVLQEKDGWYQVMTPAGEKGWVSATVCRINDATLNVAKACDHVYGVSESYEDYVEWVVGQVGDTDTYLAYTISCNMDAPIGCPWFETLWMGKKIGNVLVFDQYKYVSLSASDDAGTLELFDDNFGDEKGFNLHYGKKYTMPDNQGGEMLRLSALPMKTVNQIFNGQQNKVRYLFLGPQVFTTKYANVVLG